MRIDGKLVAPWLLLLVVHMHPQQQPGATSPRLHVVDVVIADEKGLSPREVQRSDLSLQDNGRTQDIVFFRPNRQDPRSTADAGTTPPSAVSTGSLVVLVVDGLNTPSTYQSARTELLHYAEDRARLQEVAAVYVLDTQLHMLKNLDGRVAAVNPSFTVDTVFLPAEKRVEITLAALRELARQLEAQPGRKSIVWVAAGWPMTLDPDENALSYLRYRTPGLSPRFPQSEIWGPECEIDNNHWRKEITSIAGSVSHLRLVIYTVDARSVVGAMASMTTFGGHSISDPCVFALSGNAQQVAKQTGGRTFSGTQATQSALAAARRDGTNSYAIAFPVVTSKHGRFHRLKIKARSSGLQLLYPPGYWE